MNPDLFTGSPLLAVTLGVLAGLAALRSLDRVLLLTTFAVLAQSLGWAILAAVHAGADWNTALMKGGTATVARCVQDCLNKHAVRSR